jgi:PAS domain S-box-containing protein
MLRQMAAEQTESDPYARMQATLRYRRADGSTFHADISTVRLYTVDGMEEYSLNLRDATARLETERILREAVAARTVELQASQARYQAIVETQHEMICRYLPDTTLTYVNPAYCRNHGKTPEELLGRRFIDLIPPEAQQNVLEYLQSLYDNPRIEYFEHQTLTPTGIRWQRWSDQVILNSEGRIVELQATGYDITERKMAEQTIADLNVMLTQRAAELEAANRELEAFAYSVSHDLRAPIRAIDSFTRILQDQYGATLPTQAQHYLTRVTANSARMGALIDDLLRLSRLGRQALRRTTVQPDLIVQRVLADLIGKADDSTPHIEIESLPTCYADASMLEIVYVNLIGNAVKYSRGREKPQIVIGAQQAAGEVVYFVRDNGVGFDMAYVDKLFGVFQRLHGAEFEGTGVGLATVHRIITRHGGRVWAEGAPGAGAVFFFTLGVGTAPLAAASQPSS